MVLHLLAFLRDTSENKAKYIVVESSMLMETIREIWWSFLLGEVSNKAESLPFRL